MDFLSKTAGRQNHLEFLPKTAGRENHLDFLSKTAGIENHLDFLSKTNGNETNLKPFTFFYVEFNAIATVCQVFKQVFQGPLSSNKL